MIVLEGAEPILRGAALLKAYRGEAVIVKNFVKTSEPAYGLNSLIADLFFCLLHVAVQCESIELHVLRLEANCFCFLRRRRPQCCRCEARQVRCVALSNDQVAIDDGR